MQQENPTYDGTAMLPGVTDAETAGTILFDPQRLIFRSGDGDVELQIDTLELDEDSSGRLCFSDPEQTDWLVFTTDSAVLKNYFVNRTNRLRGMARTIRQQREGKRVVKLAGIFVVAFFAIVFMLSVASHWTMKFLVRNIPVSWDARLGDSILEDVEDHIDFVDDPDLTALLNSASEPLVRSLPKQGFKFEFRVIKGGLPNAFALPGGKIFVNTGLLQTVSRREEIAGVLAHEIAHVTQRHGMRQVISAIGPYYVLKLFISDRQGFVSVISNGSQFLVQQSFSRDFEQEADDIGWRYLVSANIDPRGLAQFLERLLSDPILRLLDNSALRVLSSHPPTAERVEHLEVLWEKSSRKSGFIDLNSGSKR